MQLISLIDTTGLEYDDRIRKESLSIVDLGHQLHIVALESANLPGERMAYGRVPVTTIALRSRAWFPRGRGLLVKLIEAYMRFIVQVIRRRPEGVWFHNLNFAFVIPFLAVLRGIGVTRVLLWDQHELPFDQVLNSRLLMAAYVFLMNRCDAVVMASVDRKELVQRQVGDRLRTPIIALENYPDAEFTRVAEQPLPPEVVAWLDGAPYLLAQGGASPNRHLEELVAAVMTWAHWKLVIVGPFHPAQVDRLTKLHGPALAQWVHFHGAVPQMDLVPFVDAAQASVVFYDVRITNLRYCAANRFFQALSRGIPVMVGTNPPLRRVVEQDRCGVVVDAASVGAIVAGLENLAQQREAYRAAAAACAGVFVWESQRGDIDRLLRMVQAVRGLATA